MNHSPGILGEYRCTTHGDMSFNYFCPKCHPELVPVYDKKQELCAKLTELELNFYKETNKLEEELSSLLKDTAKKIGRVQASRKLGISFYSELWKNNND